MYTQEGQKEEILEDIEIVDDRVGVMVLNTLTEEEYEEEILEDVDTVGVPVVTKLLERDLLVEVDVDTVVETDVDTLVVVDVDPLELTEVDVEVLVLALEYVE